jgi:hypothetical protein
MHLIRNEITKYDAISVLTNEVLINKVFISCPSIKRLVIETLSERRKQQYINIYD